MSEKLDYFVEKQVVDWLHEYQRLVKTEPNAKGKPIVVDKSPRVEELERLITTEVLKIINAIIYYYKYYKFEPYDDLVQSASEACYPNYLKFNEANGTAFNFFSLITKRNLLNYTIRKRKHRETTDLGDKINIRSPRYDNNVDFFVDEVERTLNTIVDENFLGKKRQKYNVTTAVICDYFRKNKKFISKSDLYKHANGYGLRAIDMREYVKDLKQYMPQLVEIVEDDDEAYGIEDLEVDTGET